MKLSKLNISRATWVLLIAGIFVVGLVSLGMTYQVQQEQQNKLNEELLQAQLRLKKFHLEQISTEQGKLQAQVNQTMLKLENNKVMLSIPLESIDTNDIVLKIGEEQGVKVIEISSSGLTPHNIGGITSLVLPLTVRVEGDTPNLIGFIAALQKYFTTSVVESVEISFPDPGSGDKSSAGVRLTISTYEVK